MRRGTNLPAVGGFNQAVILDAIRREPAGLSRVELQERTGLAYQTVSNVTRRLVDEGLVMEGGKRISGPGKPGVLLHLAPQGRFAVGVHIDPAVITYAVVDLQGRVVADYQERTPVAETPEHVVTSMASGIEKVIEAAEVPRDRVLGVGIAAPGPIDIRRGVVLDPPHLEGWKDVPLRDALLEATDLPVVIEKDVSAAVVAELWLRGETQREDFAFFYLGTGIGLGLALEGKLVRGSSGNAGEGGTLFVPTADGKSGRTNMLGRLATPGALLAQAADQNLITVAPPASNRGEVERLFDELLVRASEGEQAVVDLFNAAADVIGASFVSIVNLLDVSEIVLGGPYWDRVADRFEERIASLISTSPDRVTHHPVRLTRSSMGDDVVAVGAATLVLDDVFAPKTTSLLISQ